MRKRYFFIPLIAIIVIAGVLVWSCKHPFGEGLSIINNNNISTSNGLFFKYKCF